MNEYALTIVDPLPITDAMVGAGSDTVPEEDYPEWSAGTTYALDAHVILASTHRIYQSLQASNLNKSPVTQPLWWIDAGPTNRWACLDSSVSTQTKKATSIKYVLIPGTTINSIAALNLTNATGISITMTSVLGGGTVYNKSIDLLSYPSSVGWWDWFYGVRRSQTQNVQIDLPSYPDGIVTFELTGGDALAMGVLLIGKQQRFGLGIQYGARVGIQDYSRKEKNEFGDTILVERAFAKRANFDLMISKGEVDTLQNFLSDIRATSCLWIASAEYESTTIFGFYKSFEILISYPTHSVCSIDLEGLT